MNTKGLRLRSPFPFVGDPSPAQVEKSVAGALP
jgi:hypothetical protein